MEAAVRNAWRDLNGVFQGRASWMYLDVKGVDRGQSDCALQDRASATSAKHGHRFCPEHCGGIPNIRDVDVFDRVYGEIGNWPLGH